MSRNTDQRIKELERACIMLRCERDGARQELVSHGLEVPQGLTEAVPDGYMTCGWCGGRLPDGNYILESLHHGHSLKMWRIIDLPHLAQTSDGHPLSLASESGAAHSGTTHS
jgi:hypothetical protein